MLAGNISDVIRRGYRDPQSLDHAEKGLLRMELVVVTGFLIEEH